MPFAGYQRICVWHLATYSSGIFAGIRVFGAVHAASSPLRSVMGFLFGIFLGTLNIF